ncbi:synaptic vesicle 2-related protein-like [Zerene cesonia]|uniref:synaptic vesicle 2-related protein-like n=1 Tax=Zerene cesonia TaxID=33412 RepID=UPI0018E4F9F8|nr:synaptic vesicle 2-related protein-like [Zerene cesonia]
MGEKNVVTFEEALDRTGFGLYNYVLVGAIGLITIAFVTVSYSTTIIVPASACELETTVTQRGLLAAGPIVGLIIGGSLWGVLSDLYGRRLMMFISLLAAAAVNALCSISVHWGMLLGLQFITALIASGQYSQGMTMLSESVPLAKRNIVVLIVSSFSLLSQGLMTALAIPIIPLKFSYYLPSLNIYWNSWRTLMVVYSIPSLISAAWIYAMEESPKFAYARGNEAESLRILRKIHRINNRGTNMEFEVEGILKENVEKQATNIKEQILPLFKTPLLKNTVIMTLLFLFQQVGSFLIWLPTIANQFVQIVQTGEGTNQTLCGVLNKSLNEEPDPDVDPCSLNVTAMVIVLAMGALHSIFNLLISVVINRVGRRNMVIIVSSVCGICGILVNVVPNVIGSGILFLIYLIGIVVTGLYAAMGVALFPTYLRVFAVALTMTGGRIGTFASVQILNFLLVNNCEVGFYTFTTIFTSSAILAAFLVDDRRLVKNLEKASKETNDL